MWVKEKRKIKRFRKKLIKKGFFEDVILDKASVVLNDPDGGISSWMFYLKKYKEIEIKKLKDLFILLDEVEFPITITKMYGENNWVRFEFKEKNTMRCTSLFLIMKNCRSSQLVEETAR